MSVQLSMCATRNEAIALAYRHVAPDGREISFRLLRHYACWVRHQKYHGVDIVTVHVESRR